MASQYQTIPMSPQEAEAMIGRIGPVTATSAVGMIPNVKVYRSDGFRWR